MKLALGLCGLLLAGGLSAQHPYQDKTLSAQQRAEDLIQRLTLEEKASLMQNTSPAIPRFGIRAYDWWNEALHGVGRAGLATVFPQSIGMAASFNDALLLEVFTAVSDEARAKSTRFSEQGELKRYQGLTMWTPNVNIFRDPRWGRGQETYGEDPFLTTRMGVAVVKGLQGPADAKYNKLHACAKHYAVHSGPEWNRHSFDAEKIAPRDLWETYLPAFKALVQKANVKEVMCAYNRYEGEPCCGSNRLLTQILRNEWGYQGIIVSDCGAISDFHRAKAHETHPDAKSASADAVINGTDLECGSEYNSLPEAVKAGLIDEARVNLSLIRLLKARFELGEMDKEVPWEIPYSVVNSDKHQKLALQMAHESITLLQNKNEILPLNKKYKVAVMGPNANDSVMQWGNYNGFPAHTVTLLEGLRKKLPETQIIYEQGCERTSQKSKNLTKLINRVKDADVVIFAGGIAPSLEGEEMKVNQPGFKGGDRTDIELPAVQRQLIKALKDAGKRIVFINYSGSAMGLVPESLHCDAILQAWYPGQAGGTALADVLLGDYNPAGRLPVTFYQNVDQLPDFENYSMKGRTYRYFNDRPLFPFGYGLSYTRFNYGKAQLSSESIRIGESATLTVPVSNVGKYDGEEVVQVYLRRPNDPEGPRLALRGFKRVAIKAGQTVSVEIPLSPESFEWFDAQSNTVHPLNGTYELLYGSSSQIEDCQKINISLL